MLTISQLYDIYRNHRYAKARRKQLEIEHMFEDKEAEDTSYAAKLYKMKKEKNEANR